MKIATFVVIISYLDLYTHIIRPDILLVEELRSLVLLLYHRDTDINTSDINVNKITRALTAEEMKRIWHFKWHKDRVYGGNENNKKK